MESVGWVGDAGFVRGLWKKLIVSFYAGCGRTNTEIFLRVWSCSLFGLRIIRVAEVQELIVAFYGEYVVGWWNYVLSCGFVDLRLVGF